MLGTLDKDGLEIGILLGNLDNEGFKLGGSVDVGVLLSTPDKLGISYRDRFAVGTLLETELSNGTILGILLVGLKDGVELGTVLGVPIEMSLSLV